MNAARAAIEKYLIGAMDQVMPGNKNPDIYRDYFGRLDDTAFDAMMDRMEKDDESFPFYHPNFTGKNIDLEHLIGLITKEGGAFMEKINMVDFETSQRFLTPIEYPILRLPLRIQQQKLQKKMSVPKDNKHVDDLTGQPTTESKGSAISYPEIQILYAMGMNKTMQELLKVRGGDEAAYRSYNNEIIATGGVNVGAIASQKTKVKSTKTVGAILHAMMLTNNL